MYIYMKYLCFIICVSEFYLRTTIRGVFLRPHPPSRGSRSNDLPSRHFQHNDDVQWGGGRWPVTHDEGNPFTSGSTRRGPASLAHAPPHRSVRAACHLAGLPAIDAEYWVGPAQRTAVVFVLYSTGADDVMVSRDVLRLREPSSARGPM